jgi:hypothetical protein
MLDEWLRQRFRCNTRNNGMGRFTSARKGFSQFFFRRHIPGSQFAGSNRWRCVIKKKKKKKKDEEVDMGSPHFSNEIQSLAFDEWYLDELGMFFVRHGNNHKQQISIS